ncbi:MAG TPA: bifunctional phosphopantothenoylcysteine decarboxylase/phosphopantothenate--cysteine ligase CoaBC [Tepidisphaeraceae bacterium]|nr:bifunctional phosphopantothenoylcysteine decarboxylase/phosphopantothenate--cysteine ligase CoaBC [Tepidisphaeraceae bacterium]
MSELQPMLKGRKVIVAVCGGIAAYKVADVVSKLVQRGAGVTVVMTEAGAKFVTPLTFQALSGRPVRTNLWDLPDSSDIQHIGLTEKADLMLVAPATANIIAKAATGICDDLVSTMINAAACPVVFCPAMNNLMWANPVTQENVQKLARLGYPMIGPEEGWLACRNVGAGRMSEAGKILDTVTQMLLEPKAKRQG